MIKSLSILIIMILMTSCSMLDFSSSKKKELDTDIARAKRIEKSQREGARYIVVPIPRELAD